MSGRGLEGVTVDSTSISYIIPEKSSLLYRGYPVSELVQKKDYRDVAFLLWNGNLPTLADQVTSKLVIKKYEQEIKKDYEPIVEILKKIPKAHPMNALRTAFSLMGSLPENTWDKDSDDILKKGLKMIMCASCFYSGSLPLQKRTGFHTSSQRSFPGGKFFIYVLRQKTFSFFCEDFGQIHDSIC